MKTRIHVNQHNIKANAKGAELPVITVKDYKQNRKANHASVVDSEGKPLVSVYYCPDNPLPCGAKVWIETELEVVTVG
jgi:hypothetical protein